MTVSRHVCPSGHVLVIVLLLVLRFLFHFLFFFFPFLLDQAMPVVVVRRRGEFREVGCLGRDSRVGIQLAAVSGTWEVAVWPATARQRGGVGALEDGDGQCRVCTTQYAKIATLFSLKKKKKKN